MGARAQVFFPEGKVYLYTHWDADELPATVQRAIAKKLRWDDAEYLARIVFEEMIDGASSKETGYGIGGTRHFDIERLITLNTREKRAAIHAVEIGGGMREEWSGSFEEFARLDIVRVGRLA